MIKINSNLYMIALQYLQRHDKFTFRKRKAVRDKKLYTLYFSGIFYLNYKKIASNGKCII